MKKYTLKVEIEVESNHPKDILNMCCVLALKDRMSDININDIVFDVNSLYIPEIDENT